MVGGPDEEDMVGGGCGKKDVEGCGEEENVTVGHGEEGSCGKEGHMG